MKKRSDCDIDNFSPSHIIYVFVGKELVIVCYMLALNLCYIEVVALFKVG